jgi:ankyrin repeat protein
MVKMSSRMSLAMKDHIMGEIYQYLQEDEDVNAVDDKIDDTLILWAARHGYIELVDYLIIHGANIEVIDMQGYTPLLASISGYHYEVFELLLESGANPNHKSFKGRSVTPFPV